LTTEQVGMRIYQIHRGKIRIIYLALNDV